MTPFPFIATWARISLRAALSTPRLTLTERWLSAFKVFIRCKQVVAAGLISIGCPLSLLHFTGDEFHCRDFRVVVLTAVRAYQRDEDGWHMVFARGNNAGVAELQGGDTFLTVGTFDGHDLFLNAVFGVQKPTALTPK
ncbi:hypothetical protein LPW36_03145 [Jinshanibacter sp. LJY008]|uniref:Uncharacterized protein n=1 Tax=Limnobaculum eriocheiris TaxID=2897391 RepID=A0A9X1MU79_9GAMM|nr:hypothetical protein [Limnobaculum eriocheiris]MCD1125034.1 hypothetical protein [Limnobaculum eriocheiris]